MVESPSLPASVVAIGEGKAFAFACHQKLQCFTECCRMLELALSPYDVLRLRHGTGLSSKELLDRYIIIEQNHGDPFPRLYLSMVDDGRESCVFVGKDGCSVYPHRPGACRTFPLGRGVRHSHTGLVERFVLIKEHFCKGFAERIHQTPRQYLNQQETLEYQRFNDLFAEILQHDAIRRGKVLSSRDIELFLLLLFDLDSLRTRIAEGSLQDQGLTAEALVPLDSDEDLLERMLQLLPRLIFPQE